MAALVSWCGVEGCHAAVPTHVLRLTYVCASMSSSSSFSGANPYPQADVDASFCDRLLSSNGYDYTNPDHAWQLMFILVSRAYNGATINGTALPPVLNDVQGLVNNRNTIAYFDGTIKYRDSPASPYHGTPTPNIRAGGAPAFALDDKITRWLGMGFGCTGGSTGFATKYPYKGVGSDDMVGVHSGMGITQLQFQAFIESVRAT
jgi:hypothetical protein